MNALITGGESFDRITLLLSLTKITSESIRGALTDYFVIGHSRTVAAALNGVDDKNLTKAIKRLQSHRAYCRTNQTIRFRKNSGVIMRITCNVCGSKSIIQSTKDAMPGYAKFYCICTNPMCSHSFVASWSYQKTLNPSLQQTNDLLIDMVQRMEPTQKQKLIKQLSLI